jgi:hypothetical protein
MTALILDVNVKIYQRRAKSMDYIMMKTMNLLLVLEQNGFPYL